MSAHARRFVREVAFKVHCESFTVPDWYGLDVSATYHATGRVTPDRSGDWITPNGPPAVVAKLGDLFTFEITLDDCLLPEWLQVRLAVQDNRALQQAFLAAIGGQEALEQLAVEKAQ